MSEGLAPLPWRWTGEALEPATSQWARVADRTLVIGEVYLLEERLERSANSHRHYFASISELWQSLPEDVAGQFPTPEALRKRALIETGWRDERSIVCGSKAEALRVASFIRPMDEHAVVITRDAVVLVLTAKTQNMRAMDKRAFSDSKNAVLEYLSNLVGVTPAEAEQNAREVA